MLNTLVSEKPNVASMKLKNCKLYSSVLPLHSKKPCPKPPRRLDQMNLEKSNTPTSIRQKINQKFRNHQTAVDRLTHRLKSLSSDRRALFGDRYTDDDNDPSTDIQLQQRQQLLSGTDRLDRSGQRLKDAQRTANEVRKKARFVWFPPTLLTFFFCRPKRSARRP